MPFSPPPLKFLHSLSERNYLTAALEKGLMLTNHNVTFSPTKEDSGWHQLLQELFPPLMDKLRTLGTSWDSLSEERQRTILHGLGSWSAMVPMLCFSEIAYGREVQHHHAIFGPYGIVINETWLKANGADRVIYIGDLTPVSRSFFMTLSLSRIASLHLNPHGVLLFHDTRELMGARTNLLAFVQPRDNLWELEWRIIGNHGIVGGINEAGKHLPINLSDIDSIVINSSDECDDFNKIITCLSEKQEVQKVPRIILQRDLPNYL